MATKEDIERDERLHGETRRRVMAGLQLAKDWRIIWGLEPVA